MQGKTGGNEVDSVTDLAAKYEKAKKDILDLEAR